MRTPRHAQLVLITWLLVAAPSLAAWAPGGNRVSYAPGNTFGARAIAFGSGGILVGYATQDPAQPSKADVYVQALDADGNLAPGWPVGGLALATAPVVEVGVSLVPAGDGGAFVGWIDFTSSTPALFVQRVTVAGAIAAGWPSQGLHFGDGSTPVMAPDGAGGVYLMWASVGVSPPTMRLMRLDANGQVMPGWPSDGVAIATGSLGGSPVLASDHSGGLFIAWSSSRLPGLELVVQHLVGEGTPDPGWPSGGFVASDDRMAMVPRLLQPDGVGGVRVVWTQVAVVCPQFGCGGSDVAIHLDSHGAPLPTWPAAGRVLGPTGQVAFDGVGGVLGVWIHSTPDFPMYANPDLSARVTRLDAEGALPPGWSIQGNPACIERRQQTTATIAGDGAGGGFVSWIDTRTFEPVLYATRIGPTGAIAPGWPASGAIAATSHPPSDAPTLVEVGPGRAIVLWTSAQDGTRDLYAKLVEPGPAGPPALFVPDRYGTFDFGLARVRPNPAQGVFYAVVALPTPAPATVDLVDAGGRTVESHALDAQSPGRGGIAFNAGSRLPAGVYWLRLRQADRTTASRVVILK